MTVAERGVVDYVATSEDGARYTLIMLEDRPLDSADLLDETLMKVNDYLRIIISGAFVTQFPEAAGARFAVQYNVLDDPEDSPELLRLLGAAAGLYETNGIDFAVRHLNL